MSKSIDEQNLLQQEADDLVELLGLLPILERIGRPVRVGSSAMGLMVRRDIDITVICRTLDDAARNAIVGLSARLMTTDHVGGVRFRNDSGGWNADPSAYPDGLYLGISARTRSGENWNLDVWFIDQPERQPDIAHLNTLLPRITDEHREVILAIKRELAESPRDVPSNVRSFLVYEAVVDHGVRDTMAFEAWLGNRSASVGTTNRESSSIG
jgi:hypothetical protein